ncbi:hypothetical protein [Novosphingobium sp.]|uniref:hypothetical protein n=1 Tax=Novosphingobium sp. TaxID=1874826 RepID=UPI0035AFC715
MNEAASKLARDRANRKAARSLFDARISQVKADLEARPIGGRIADKAGEEAMNAANEALAVAKESKGIIAAMVAALALWFFRNPLIAFFAQHFSPQAEVQED